jgi:Pterin 4 alpha carbinolamine dehydratase
MPGLDDTTVAEGLQRLPGWERRGNQLAKTFVRADFARAMVFVNEVAAAAEVAGHHPDIDIRCRRLLPRHHRTPWPVPGQRGGSPLRPGVPGAAGCGAA